MPEPVEAHSAEGRRTQAERRAATRAALLDAALAVLVEEGYSNLTTRRVAERAGVSQGTQMHYFPTRASFLAESLRHVAGELEDELRAQVGRGVARDPRRRLAHALDEIWTVHKGPVFQASMELWVAARTDEELRESMREVADEITRMIAGAAQEIFPEVHVRRGAGGVLETSLAAIRGLAMLKLHGDPQIERRWKRTREHLLALYDGLPVEAPAATL